MIYLEFIKPKLNSADAIASSLHIKYAEIVNSIEFRYLIFNRRNWFSENQDDVYNILEEVERI